MTEVIGSAQNRKYKYIRSLLQKKYRAEYRRYTVEGIKSVSEAAASGAELEMIVVSEGFSADIDLPHGVRVVTVRDELFAALCDTKTPQGIIAVIKMREREQYSCDRGGLYIYCDRIADPGNLGTIIRTADAAGFAGVLLSPGCADLYSPKTVRASMGSFFRVEVIQGLDTKWLMRQRDEGFSICCGALLPDSKDFGEYDYTKPHILVVGNEANGVGDDILEVSEHIIIPIYGGAESLNAGVAAALMMYEAARCRHNTEGHKG